MGDKFIKKIFSNPENEALILGIRDHWIEVILEEIESILVSMHSLKKNTDKTRSQKITSDIASILTKTKNSVQGVFLKDKSSIYDDNFSINPALKNLVTLKTDLNAILSKTNSNLSNIDPKLTKILNESSFSGKHLESLLSYVNNKLSDTHKELKRPGKPASAIIDRFIRKLNDGSWQQWLPIHKEFDLSIHNPHSTNGKIPISYKMLIDHFPINETFHSYFKNYGKTGLSSMSASLDPKENNELTRVTNFWLTQAYVSASDALGKFKFPLFVGLRSGSMMRSIVSKADNKHFSDSGKPSLSEGEQRKILAEEFLSTVMLHVASRCSKSSNNGFLMPLDGYRNKAIRVVSVILQTDGIGGEGKMIEQQEKMLSDYDQKSIENSLSHFQKILSHLSEVSEDKFSSYNSELFSKIDKDKFNHKIFSTHHFDITVLKAEVNNLGGLHLTSINSSKTLDKFMKVIQENMFLGDQGEFALFHRKVIYEKKSGSKSTYYYHISELFRQVALRAIYHYMKNTNLKNSSGSYIQAAVFALGGFYSNQFVHFNCKSGKDRTGFLNSEIIHLATNLLLNFYFVMKNLRFDFSSENSGALRSQLQDLSNFIDQNWKSFFQENQKHFLLQIMENSGNFEIQQLNTSAPGYKVITSSKFSRTDKKYQQRLGEDEEGEIRVQKLKAFANFHSLK